MIKVGIFFGGRSREREVSFAGGRTVYDNLNKALFEPIPIFVDNWGNLILLDWQYIYKGSIRDFYPPSDFIPQANKDIQIYADSLGDLSQEEQDQLLAEIGQKLTLDALKSHIDFAFLALHGSYGEDGSMQGILDYLGIPYSGSGILASAIGMNKSFQKELFREKSFGQTRFQTITRKEWFGGSKKKIYEQLKKNIGIPLVSRPANQGSSIGVGILMKDDYKQFCENMDLGFFCQTITKKFWTKLDETQKTAWLREVCDLRSNIGLPLNIGSDAIYTPAALERYLDEYFAQNSKSIRIEANDGENEVLLEEFIDGKEFSCIVIRNENGKAIALPPTGIVKGKEIFDYRSKYLPGMSRKVTPIDLSNKKINSIQERCIELFEFLKFDVYARIDGFIQANGKIILNDPNTTSGMLPSSFFFHQAAEIGLNPSQFLTYLIRQSLAERHYSLWGNPRYKQLLTQLDEALEQFKQSAQKQLKVGVILGGYSSERHISVESGRNIYEKLASSTKYEPIPIFLTGKAGDYKLYQIPINLLLKDNADDIADKIKKFKKHPITESLKKECKNLRNKYGNVATALEAPKLLPLKSLKTKVDFAFIALHGRPGEDGELQAQFEKMGIPFNGSPSHSAAITIDKYATNQLLKEAGFCISDQLLTTKEKWKKANEAALESIFEMTSFPLIAKPVDDGCSSAVKLLHNQNELDAFADLIFRRSKKIDASNAHTLQLKPNEEFPRKEVFLVEEFTTAKNAKHFLEITGGLLSRWENGKMEYEVFEPSETLSSSSILSLEEKFLAGEGQNLTPARFSSNRAESKLISFNVRADLLKAAQKLKIEGYARIDAFVRIFEDGKVETIVIEANSLPGMTPATAIFHQAALNGYKPYEFIDQIIQFGLERVK